MTSQKNMEGLTVYKDYVVHHRDTQTHHPSIENLALQKLAMVVIRWQDYWSYLSRTQRMRLSKSSDYDGIPFEDSYELLYENSNGRSSTGNSSVLVAFHSTHEEDHDYTAMVSQSTTTAYNRGKNLEPRERKFKVHHAIIKRKDGDADVWIQGELLRLQIILDDLDKATKSLRSWADNGLDMRAMCKTYLCRPGDDPAIIPCKQLLTYVNKGFSLDDLKKKLICKVCGARCSGIAVA